MRECFPNNYNLVSLIPESTDIYPTHPHDTLTSPLCYLTMSLTLYLEWALGLVLSELVVIVNEKKKKKKNAYLPQWTIGVGEAIFSAFGIGELVQYEKSINVIEYQNVLQNKWPPSWEKLCGRNKKQEKASVHMTKVNKIVIWAEFFVYNIFTWLVAKF